MSDWINSVIITLVFVAIVALIGWGIVASVNADREWKAFVVKHECEVVAQVESSTNTCTGVVYDANGKPGMGVVTIHTPGKTAWLCDDGITYWRNK